MVHPQQPQARLSTRPSILPSSLIHPSQQPHNRPLTRPLTSSSVCPSSPAHHPSTQNCPSLPFALCGLELVAACLHCSHAEFTCRATRPFSCFSLVHSSVCSSIFHPFILLVLLIINPSAQHPSLYSVLCVLVWPTLLTTETLNPRPRDPQETKSPCVGHGELTACEAEALRCVGGFTPASPGLPHVLSLVGSQRLCFCALPSWPYRQVLQGWFSMHQ